MRLLISVVRPQEWKGRQHCIHRDTVPESSLVFNIESKQIPRVAVDDDRPWFSAMYFWVNLEDGKVIISLLAINTQNLL